MNIEGKRVLVTGGSSGIGLALAKAFLAKHAKVVISGRRPDALAKAVERFTASVRPPGASSPMWRHRMAARRR
jgi:NAD(P)-dependent dehydrogenase (short-subunit alcohol dehydrogenase family)